MIMKADLWLNLTLVYLHSRLIQRGPHLPASLYVIQGTVTEDKNSASHVVYPVPGNLEEGEAWVSWSLQWMAWTRRWRTTQ